jgi:hypothetical protein
MKKLFTLIGVALIAMSANAQEVWKASEKLTFDETTKKCNEMTVEDCTNESFFKVESSKKVYPVDTYKNGATDVVASDGAPLTLKSYIITATAGSVSMKAISTPNDDASENESWQLGGGGNNALDTDACEVKFDKYIKPKNGNPSMSYKAFYEYNSNNEETYRVYEDLWTPELKKMPTKGLYYEFTSTKAGKLVLALIVWRPGNKVYFFDKETFTQFPTSALSISGYVNNNTVIWGSNTEAFSTITMTENHDYQMEGIPGKQILGYMTLDIEANKTYVLLSSNAQPGLYGFYLVPAEGGENGIATVATESKNAPIFNLAGQRVSKNVKGLMIQNGKKFIVK